MKLLLRILLLLILPSVSAAQIWQSYNDSLMTSYKNGDDQRAVEWGKKALVEAEIEFGKSHGNYATSLNNLGFLYQSMGRYSEAEPFLVESIKVKKTFLGEEHPDYAISINSLVKLYKSMGRYSDEEPLLVESAKIKKKILGEVHPDYATSLNNLADLYQSLGRFAEAEPLYLQSMRIFNKVMGKEHPSYATLLNNLAALYEDWGRYDVAETLYVQSLKIRQKVLSEEHPDYATSLNNLAGLYIKIDRYDEAEPLLLKSVNIRKKLLGEEHLDYASSLNNLAFLYVKMRRYAEVEPLYLQSMKIQKKALGEDHPDYASSLNNLGQLYESLGRYQEAETLLLQSMKVRKKTLGEEHPDYATSLNDLAVIYKSMGRFTSAEPLYLQSMKIRKKALGEDHPAYASSLNNLGQLYESLGRYQEAETLLLQSMKVRKKVLGEDHPDYASSLNSLALLYGDMGRYKEAELLHLLSIKIQQQALGEEDPDYASSLNSLAVLYEYMGQYTETETLFKKALISTKKFIELIFPSLSEKEQVQFFSTIQGQFPLHHSFSFQYKQGVIQGFEEELLSKSLFLSNSVNLRKAALASNDNKTIEIFNQWNTLSSFIAKQYAKPIAERISGIDTIEMQVNILEKKLNSLSNNFNERQSLTKTTLQDISKRLKQDELVIEFSSFQFYNKRWTDSTFYCAYLLRGNDATPKQIFLFEQKQIDSLLILFNYSACAENKCISQKINSFHTWNINGKKLYELIWSKIEPYLKGVSTVYYSPSGSLHKISIPAIPTSDSTVLSDKYHLVQLNSTREIALESFKPLYVTDTATLVLFGGIKYDMDTTALKNATATYHPIDKEQPFAFASRSYVSDTSTRGTTWRYLSGTLSEVEFIKPLFKQSDLFTGAQATEEAFKSFQGKQAPDILHVATHGFFFQEGERKKDHQGKIREFEYSNDPLIRSGLMMAGGNLKWKGAEIPENLEDGILTAKEVAALNLYNTKLVVLSACETGLGDIKGSEGVYGLQRAFKAAGVDYLLMSLWSVPDKPTAEFMQTFYTKLKTGSDIQTAFEQTQTAMKLQYRNEPYNWAGFVLLR